MFLLALTVFDEVAAVIVIWSNKRQVVPESVVIKILTRAAADVAAHWASISRIRVPVDAPVISDVMVPVPSIAVLAVATLTVVSLDVPMNDGLAAIFILK
jgi:hypothetical protein